MRRTTRTAINLRVSDEALLRADKLADELGVSRSEVLRAALSAGLPLVEQRAKEPKV